MPPALNEPRTLSVTDRWPGYDGWLIGAGVLMLALMGAGLVLGWWSALPLALVGLLVIVYLAWQPRWLDRQIRRDDVVADWLWQTADLTPNATFVVIDVGLKGCALQLGRRLAGGSMQVIDIYNPQVMPAPLLTAWRKVAAAQQPEPDPRMEWLEGRSDLLPLADNSTPVVFLTQVLSEMSQSGDQLILLEEIKRILEPGGRVLLAERVRSESNRWVLGPLPPCVESAELVQEQLARSGLQAEPFQPLNGVLMRFCGRKTTVRQIKQLRFDF
jgi:SAM-dependent methyltransferase